MLTEQQKKAAQMLCDGWSIPETAEAVGVHRVTVWRWTKRRDFRRERRRINHNSQRRAKRALARAERERLAKWQPAIEKAEKDLEKAGKSIHKGYTPALNHAWNELKTASMQGVEWSQVERILRGEEPKPPTKKWKRKPSNGTGPEAGGPGVP